jgi:hypothetical protein
MAPALLLSVLVHAGAVRTFFAQDDITFLSRAAGLEPGDGWFRPISAGVAFRLGHALFGLDPFGYHLTNLLLHLANVALLFALVVRLGGSRGVAAAAAVLFGVSSIAFTPLHWASGVMELLTCALLLAATLLWLESRSRRQSRRCWIAAIVAVIAVFSKETAAAWLVGILVIEWSLGGGLPRRQTALAASMPTLVFAIAFLLSGQARKLAGSEAYAYTFSPLFIAQNLLTYLQWSVTFTNPIRDVVAAADPGAWRMGLPVTLALAVFLWRRPRAVIGRTLVGIGWWLAFLLPVLPLAHHTYLYYLYIPWVGGALALASLGQSLLAALPRRTASAVGLMALAGFVLIEARNVEVRRTATRDALPVDRTMRDATLLGHALPALQSAALPPGTRVAFVNPVPRGRFDLVTGLPTKPEDLPHRTSYYPLEAAMRRGETLLLFLPGLVYLGFADTIPSAWEGAECFYFEQRGWLRAWGRGQRALMHQAEVQMDALRWASAERTLRRVRALADTIPRALQWQITALMEQGLRDEARVVAEEFVRRWPTLPFVAQADSLRNAPVTPPGSSAPRSTSR